MNRFVTLFFLFLSFFAAAQPDTTQKIMAGRKNSPEQQNKPYVILISIDGFRYDYVQKHKAHAIRHLSKKGVRAEYMMPSYPSLTFPNHYTIVTGMYPSHHGLVGNSFYDREKKGMYTMRSADKVTSGAWYGGTPLWVLAEQQKMLTASFYWVGSEADIQGIRPTYYYRYNENIGLEKRIQTVVDWLNLPAERRPHFISFYFPEVDHAGHHYGPDAPLTRDTVQWVDSAICKLTRAVQTTGLDVNFVLVSDHGMTRINTEQTLRPAFDTSKFIMATHGELVHLYAKNPSDIQPAYESLKAQEKNFTVYLKKDVPERWHYGPEDDVLNRIGDILLVPSWPYVFNFSSRKPNPGSHGYDPYLVPDMRAIFYAWGPAFKKERVGAVRNVDLYPVITRLLGLTYTHPIDGTPKLADKILRKPASGTK